MGPEIIFVATVRNRDSAPVLSAVPPTSRLERALWEMRIFQKKYQDLLELSPILLALKLVLQQIEQKKAA